MSVRSLNNVLAYLETVSGDSFFDWSDLGKDPYL